MSHIKTQFSRFLFHRAVHPSILSREVRGLLVSEGAYASAYVRRTLSIFFFFFFFRVICQKHLDGQKLEVLLNLSLLESEDDVVMTVVDISEQRLVLKERRRKGFQNLARKYQQPLNRT